jgi:hypothetical protein
MTLSVPKSASPQHQVMQFSRLVDKRTGNDLNLQSEMEKGQNLRMEGDSVK